MYIADDCHSRSFVVITLHYRKFALLRYIQLTDQIIAIKKSFWKLYFVVLLGLAKINLWNNLPGCSWRYIFITRLPDNQLVGGFPVNLPESIGYCRRGMLASKKRKPPISPSIHLYGTILTMEMRVSVIHIIMIIISSLSEKYWLSIFIALLGCISYYVPA